MKRLVASRCKIFQFDNIYIYFFFRVVVVLAPGLTDLTNVSIELMQEGSLYRINCVRLKWGKEHRKREREGRKNIVLCLK